MRSVFFTLILTAFAQSPLPPRGAEDPSTQRLPDGRLQSEEILKEEHRRSLKDLDEILKYGTEVKIEFEKHDHHVVSMGALRKLDEMEKRIKRIRGRLRR